MDQTSETEKVFQKHKYNEIVEVLLTAGYFRARINLLSEFDKVVGGLCWCITSSGEAVDVDILFQENSTIGQRIALSEAIVTALRKMGCPFPLQPHQIQGGVGGSDYPAIYQVIVWLVKKYFERREERDVELRAYSTFQFSKGYRIPVEERPLTTKVLNERFAALKPIRLYKPKLLKNESSEETKVHSCLLEFGESFIRSDVVSVGRSDQPPEQKYENLQDQLATTLNSRKALYEKVGDLPSTSTASGQAIKSVAEQTLLGLDKIDINELSLFEKQLAKAAREAKREELLFAEQISKEESELMKHMFQLKEGNSGASVSGSQVGSIVGLGSTEIGSAFAAYSAQVEESKKALDSDLASGKLGKAAAHHRQKQNLLKQRDEVVTKKTELQIVVSSLASKGSHLREEQENTLQYVQKLKNKFLELLSIENNAKQQDDLASLRNLVLLNDSLKGQEQAFKATCKTQLNDLQNALKAATEDDTSNSDENKKLNDIESMHSKVHIFLFGRISGYNSCFPQILGKYNRLRQLLAETNLEVSSAARTIDDTPTRTELIQYERRFAELYQQVAWKLEETRKYYAIYNTLDSTHSFLSKEVILFLFRVNYR